MNYPTSEFINRLFRLVQNLVDAFLNGIVVVPGDGRLSPAYPVFFDMEEKRQIDGLNNKTRTDMAVTFCETIKKAGYTAGNF
mgnify:CR=1 FL=1